MLARRIRGLVAAGLLATAGMASGQTPPEPANKNDKPAEQPRPTLLVPIGSTAYKKELPPPTALPSESHLTATLAAGSCGTPSEAPAGGSSSACKSGCGCPERIGAVPFGATVNQAFRTQAANGVAVRMTLYDYDFVCGTDKLNQRGKDRLRWIACMVPQTPFPIVIERTPQTPQLAEARRVAVVNELHEALGMAPTDRVVIGPPVAIPMRGVEAEWINENFKLQTLQFGFPLYMQMYGGGSGGVGGGSTFGGPGGTSVGGGAVGR